MPDDRDGREKQVLPDGSKLVVTDDTVCPFSWMGYIVISQKDMDESGEEILTHEMAHIRARHSVDMLICSFLRHSSMVQSCCLVTKTGIGEYS